MDVYQKFQNLPKPEFEVINCEKCHTQTVDDFEEGIMESTPAQVNCKCPNCGHTNAQTRWLTKEQYNYYCDVLRKGNEEPKTLNLSKSQYISLRNFIEEISNLEIVNRPFLAEPGDLNLSSIKEKASELLKII